MVKTAIQNGKQVFIIDTRENDALIMIPHAYSSLISLGHMEVILRIFQI